MDIQINALANGVDKVEIEATVDAETALVYASRPDRDGEPRILLMFRCNGGWYYQPLMWSCRGGRQRYYRALVALYRHLRANGLTAYSLRYLAWGERRTRNGGFAIRTSEFVEYQAFLSRIRRAA